MDKHFELYMDGSGATAIQYIRNSFNNFSKFSSISICCSTYGSHNTQSIFLFVRPCFSRCQSMHIHKHHSDFSAHFFVFVAFLLSSISVSTRSHAYLPFCCCCFCCCCRAVRCPFHPSSSPPFFQFYFSIRQFNDDLSELEYIIGTVNEDVFTVQCFYGKLSIDWNLPTSHIYFPSIQSQNSYKLI